MIYSKIHKFKIKKLTLANGEIRYRVYVKKINWWHQLKWDYLVNDYDSIDKAMRQIEKWLEEDELEYMIKKSEYMDKKYEKRMKRLNGIVRSETIPDNEIESEIIQNKKKKYHAPNR